MRVAFTKGNFSPNQNKSGFSAPSASVFAPENTEQETAEGKAGCRHRWATPSPAPRAASGGRAQRPLRGFAWVPRFAPGPRRRR